MPYFINASLRIATCSLVQPGEGVKFQLQIQLYYYKTTAHLWLFGLVIWAFIKDILVVSPKADLLRRVIKLTERLHHRLLDPWSLRRHPTLQWGCDAVSRHCIMGIESITMTRLGGPDTSLDIVYTSDISLWDVWILHEHVGPRKALRKSFLAYHMFKFYSLSMQFLKVVNSRINSLICGIQVLLLVWMVMQCSNQIGNTLK